MPMSIAHKRAASSFISLHAGLDLPVISIGIDVDVPALASLLDIGHTGEVTPVPTTLTELHTSSTGEFTLVTSKTTVAAGTSTSHTLAVTPTAGSSGNNDGHGRGATSAISFTNTGNPSSILEGTSTSNDVPVTFTSDTTSRLKQGSTTSGTANDILLVATLSGSVTTTITMPANTGEAIIPFAPAVSSGETLSNLGKSANSLASATTSGAFSDPTGNGSTPTNKPPGGSSKRNLSPGAIAGIVIALLLLFLGIFVVICRRRKAYRRDQAALGWSRSRSSYQYQDELSPRPQDVFRRFTMPFTTNMPNSFNEDTPILSPPPMAEYARSTRSSRSAASSLPHSLESSFHDRGHRLSGSDGSSINSTGIPSLLIDTQEITIYDTAPMSAPPFSSSKSFVLSNPPIPTIRISAASAPPSKSLFIPSYRPITVDLPPIPPLPSSPPPMPPTRPFRAKNPFEDPPG